MRETGTHHSSYGRRSLMGWMGATMAGAVVLLAGCGAAPPKPVVTPVALSLVGAPDVNPDARGRASPVTVRVYALKTSGPFDGADFFSLYEKDQATLGAELVQREEMLLRPGESRKLEMTLPADAKALAFMAAYRDLDRARWREVRAVEPGKPVGLNVVFGARQIRLEPAPPPPAPAK